jgi:ribonucleoside-diphosphate reductase beta chain
VQIFTPVCSVPEIEAWVQWWSAFEQIHSESYSHIIRNIYQMPSEQFNQIHDTAAIVDMLSNIDKYYHDLHQINCAKETLAELKALDNAEFHRETINRLETLVAEDRHVKAIYLAMIASYGLEAIRFMVSFATSFGMVENKIFIGNGNIISLIAADELLHTSATAYIIQTLVKTDERFRDAANELRAEANDMWASVISEEKAWAHYQFQKGTILGLNEKIMCAQVDWRGQETSRALPSICGVKYEAGVKSTPLPWMNKHLNTNKTQTALQENESVTYVLSSMTPETDFTALPNL